MTRTLVLSAVWLVLLALYGVLSYALGALSRPPTPRAPVLILHAAPREATERALVESYMEGGQDGYVLGLRVGERRGRYMGYDEARDAASQAIRRLRNASD